MVQADNQLITIRQPSVSQADLQLRGCRQANQGIAHVQPANLTMLSGSLMLKKMHLRGLTHFSEPLASLRIQSCSCQPEVGQVHEVTPPSDHFVGRGCRFDLLPEN